MRLRARCLALRDYELMDYQDGQLEFVDFSVAAGRLVERMRRFRPDVVITFGGDGGMNTHAGPYDGLDADNGGISLVRAGEAVSGDG